MNLKQVILNGYRPKSRGDEAAHIFAELHRRAPARLTFHPGWQGIRDTLKPLAAKNIAELGIAKGSFGAAVDTRGRKLLVIPITLGHVVVREAGFDDEFKNWASPIAQGLEGVARNNVGIDFVLACIGWSGWKPTP